MRAWIDRHPLLTNLALMLVVVVPGYFRIEGIVSQACEDRRNQAVLLRSLVEISDDGRGSTNLTRFPSFDQLDPETQTYLREVEAASRQAPEPSEFVRHALALVDVPEC